MTLGRLLYLSESVTEGWKWLRFSHCPCPWEVQLSGKTVLQTNHDMNTILDMCTWSTISPGDESVWEYQRGLLRGGDTFAGFLSSSSCRYDGWALKHTRKCTPKGMWELPPHVVIGLSTAKKWTGAVAWGKSRSQSPDYEGRRMVIRSEMKAITLVHQVQHENNPVNSKWSIPLWDWP